MVSDFNRLPHKFRLDSQHHTDGLLSPFLPHVGILLVSQSLRNIKDVKNTLNNIETVSTKNDEKFQTWNRTMSATMQELRDKIAKARHIAEGVSGVRIHVESANSSHRLLMTDKNRVQKTFNNYFLSLPSTDPHLNGIESNKMHSFVCAGHVRPVHVEHH